MLQIIFMVYVLRTRGGWSGDLLVADCDDLKNLSTSELHVKRSKQTEL